MTTNIAGNVWIAFWGSSVVAPLPPARMARSTEEVRLPARQSTSVYLGVPDLSRLFITTARYGLRRPTLRDGALFAIDVNVPAVRLTNSSLRQNLKVAASYREVDSRRIGACRSQEPARSGDG